MAGKKKYVAPEIEEMAVTNEAEEEVAEDIEQVEVKAETTFTKVQLLSAERFSGRRDLLSALLDENKSYTVRAVEEMIENYMKGQVK